MTPQDKAILTFAGVVTLMAVGSMIHGWWTETRRRREARALRIIDKAVRRDINIGSWS